MIMTALLLWQDYYGKSVEVDIHNGLDKNNLGLKNDRHCFWETFGDGRANDPT